MLTTRRKLAIARVASLALRCARGSCGLGAELEATRNRTRWALDLREGIDLAIYLGQYQTVPQLLLDILQEKPRSTAVDIGANIGAFALPLARAAGPNGHIVACEATAFAFAKLKRNLALNPDLERRVTTIQAVLGDGQEDGAKAPIYSSWRVDGSSDHAEHPLHGGRPMSTEGAVGISFDALVESREDLRSKISRLAIIKLDVDGHELSILRGARRTIDERRPALLIEIAPYVSDERENGLAELISEIEGQGYRLHDPETGAPVSHVPDDLRKLIPHGAGADLLGLRVG